MRYKSKITAMALVVSMFIASAGLTGCGDASGDGGASPNPLQQSVKEVKLVETDTNYNEVCTQAADVSYFDRMLDDEGNLMVMGLVVSGADQKSKDYYYTKAVYNVKENKWDMSDLTFSSDKENYPNHQPAYFQYVDGTLYGNQIIKDMDGNVTGNDFFEFDEDNETVNKIRGLKGIDWTTSNFTWLSSEQILVFGSGDLTEKWLKIFNASTGDLVSESSEVPSTDSTITDGENIYILTDDSKGIGMYDSNYQLIKTIPFSGQTVQSTCFAMTVDNGDLYVVCKEGIFRTDITGNSSWENLYKPGSESEFTKMCAGSIDKIIVDKDGAIYVGGWEQQQDDFREHKNMLVRYTEE